MSWPEPTLQFSFLHIPSDFHTQPTLSCLPALLQGVPSAFLHMQFLSIITDQYRTATFPQMLQPALALKILLTPLMTLSIFLLAVATFVTNTFLLCYQAINSLKIP